MDIFKIVTCQKAFLINNFLSPTALSKTRKPKNYFTKLISALFGYNEYHHWCYLGILR